MQPHSLLIAAIGFLPFTAPAESHEGPDPVIHVRLDQASVKDGILISRLGPNVLLADNVRAIDDDHGGLLYFRGRKGTSKFELKDSPHGFQLPSQNITVAAWVSVDETKDWGGIVGRIQDNGDFEKGWLLGYRKDRFSFALSSQGADDGDGTLTYLTADKPFEKGRLYHVVGIYDGATMQLYVNGRLAAESKEQSGPILYPPTGEFNIAGYKDDNEDHPHHGSLRSIRVFDLAAKPLWVRHDFTEQSAIATLKPNGMAQGDLKLRVKPYLQFGTKTEMTIMWQTSDVADGLVRFGETSDCEQQNQKIASTVRGIHEHRLTGLKPETQYFYQTVSTTAAGDFIESEVKTFVTAVHETTPYAFAVMSDTQGNPNVSAKISKMAWAQRPSFLLHSGDLVSTGTNDSHWTNQFFPGVEELVCRVPFYSVLGNHEQNASNYFDYVSVPKPEYYFDFHYGNAQFFLIDSNRKIAPGSEQFQWLEEKLKASTAEWKFVCHHHPPYSSDENDYGNLWKTNKGSRGDLRARQLVQLYDKYEVDIVWNGHIHSYERTWPLRNNKAVNDRGTIYMVTGGAGGGLETAGPVRPFFQNNVRHGHHYVMVYVNGTDLEFKAFDLDGRLFDTFSISKR